MKMKKKVIALLEQVVLLLKIAVALFALLCVIVVVRK
jgi:hypothetical protein